MSKYEIGEGFYESKECVWVNEVWRWFLAIISLSTSEALALHQTCVISKKLCKQEELSWTRKAKFNELIVYLMHGEIIE